MDTYDTEASNVVGRRDSSRFGAMGEGHLIRVGQANRRASGTLSDVHLDGSGIQGGRQRRASSKIFLEAPMYSQEAEKKRHRTICSVLIFLCFVALGIGIFVNTKMGGGGSAAAPSATPNATESVIPEETIGNDKTTTDTDEDEEPIETDNAAATTLEEEAAAIEEERQQVLNEETLLADSPERADLLAQEAEALGDLETALESEQEIVEETREVENDQELEVLDEEAAVEELIEDNESGQAGFLDQAVDEDDPDEVQELKDEVYQLGLQEGNLEDQLDAEHAQEEKLTPPADEEGEEEEEANGGGRRFLRVSGK